MKTMRLMNLLFLLLVFPTSVSAIQVHGKYFGPNDKMPRYIVTFENCYPSYPCEEFCTGTIIEADWILTAGHCNVGPGHVVRLHAHGQPSSWTQRVVEVKRPPGVDYKNNTVNGVRMDLALVRLDKPIPLGDQFRKARITSSFPVAGMKGWVAGGGDHDGRSNERGILKWADAKIDKYFANTNTLLLSVWANPGDSGGPFMRWFNDNPASGDMELIGVWSAVLVQPYMTFVGTPAVRAWIMTTIGKPI